MSHPRRVRALGPWLSALGTFLLTLSVALPAFAERIQISAEVESDRVEVGSVVGYSLKVVVNDGPMASDPKPGNIAGFTLGGTSSAPMQMHMNLNGTPSSMNTLVTRWTLRADKIGTFTLGPASAAVSGTRRSAQAVRITVVPRGQGGGPARRGNDPFAGTPFGNAPDPFGGAFSPFRDLFGDDEPEPPALRATADPKLNLDAPRAPAAFLHATIDKTRAVMGEQVTLNVYLYSDPMARQGQPTDVHEATANDFVKKSLLEDDARAIDLGTALVGGKVWHVNLVRKNALFPLKTGRLTIAPMALTMSQLRAGLRESEELTVDVGEAPAAGRPTGFVPGDVGDFSLQASLSDRTIDQDGAVGVNLELRGTGNLPSQLTLPEIPGVEWLEPTVREKLGAMQNEKYGGTRTFSYVVRVHKAGAVDLGEVRLPFYNPDKKSYGVARASIGILDVKPGSQADAGVTPVDKTLADLPAVRTAMERPSPESHLAEGLGFWALLFGAPLGVVAALGGERALRAIRSRKRETSADPAKLAKERLREAEALVRGEDGAAAMGAIARAVQAAVQIETGVNLRGTSAAAAEGELVDAGVPEGTARGILDLLRRCEDARFSPSGVSRETASAAWDDARARLAELEAGS